MTEQIIPIVVRTVGVDTIRTVNARDLHAFLGVGKDFSNWIKDQIVRAKLVENRDFIIVAEKGENSGRGRSSIEYYLTIEAAKHIAMMSGTDKGVEVRDYFIECERVAITAPRLPSDPILAQIAILQAICEKQLALESGQKVLATGLAETHHEVTSLKQNMRVENWQQCNLKKAVDAKIQEFKELYPSIDVSDCYRKVWRYFKNKYCIPRYNELPAAMYEEAILTIHQLAMHNLAGL